MSRRLLAVLVLSILLVATGCTNLSIRMSWAKANKLYKAQEYEKAIEEYKKITSLQPDHYMANYLIAMSNMALYHPGSTHQKDVKAANDALTALRKLLTLKAPNADYAEKIEKYYLTMLKNADKGQEAITYLEAKRRKDPKDVIVVRELARSYAEIGDFEKTIQAYRDICQLEPKRKENWYTLGVVCWERSYKGAATVSDEEREKLVAEGQKALDQALALDPDYFDALSYYNLLHREQAKVYYNREMAEAYTGELKKAEAMLKRALEARRKQIAKQKEEQNKSK